MSDDVIRDAVDGLPAPYYDRVGPREPPSYDRTYLGSEPEDVRVYLLGGEDRAVVRGDEPGSITVRIMGGGRADTLIDETAGSGRVRFHDDRGDNEIIRGANTKVYESVYVPPDVVESYGASPIVALSDLRQASGRGRNDPCWRSARSSLRDA